MERRSIVVSGIVQGVGFRPFVYGLASLLGLSGFIRNQSSGVVIEVEGETPRLDCFLADITSRPPPLAIIRHVFWEERSPCGSRQFRIEPSRWDRASQVLISADVATCSECLAELFDPPNRRYLYPFINCNVTKRGWMAGIGGCPNVGGIYIGCTMPGFPDKYMPFMDESPGGVLSSGVIGMYGTIIRRLRSITNITVNKEPKWRHNASRLTIGYHPSTNGSNGGNGGASWRP